LEIDSRQVGAPSECALIEVDDTVGDRDARKAAAVTKRFVSDAADTVAYALLRPNHDDKNRNSSGVRLAWLAGIRGDGERANARTQR
jgi:hypothetical protein